MIKMLTKQYIKAFNNKNLDEIAKLLDESFILQDPVVRKISGKNKCLNAIEDIFKSANKLSFNAKNIYQDKNATFIEFILILDGLKLEGVDIIEWKGEKIVELRAYLDTKGTKDE
ncbi:MULTISPECIES: nuclear transport factor 2 family protein [Campylobacter]|uniref:Nuclear transport factor 2 family protein n=1 Tax=Campylobacter porcelli TaxID=1660073 RepID=A0A1X9SXU3_9BACT|nr:MULTISPECIES: nuclear transport factor 2 family protein [unclassified Campylobacter]ARR01041.1 SnoaL-like domain protein [Campylobacter sp. RM6137]MCR8696651.1 nuclear transport factor 2 family protein [Campylobacter sp. RM19073]MEE3705268.1 nuclear transport factor 2 family protein [Campylobacter sp. CX2-8023-23]MEE3744983.1 nuclear transport factor 2 family protein [Campylobacter sp. CX2-4855-23]